MDFLLGFSCLVWEIRSLAMNKPNGPELNI